MKFNPKARLSPSRSRQRGSGGGSSSFGLPGGSGGGLRLPTGGGIVGIILVIVIAVVATQCSGATIPGLPGGGSDDASQSTEDCNRQAAEGRLSDHCVIVYTTNSVAEFWSDALPEQAGLPYVEISTDEFAGGVSTGCGQASSAMGPFYCPLDQTVYLDSRFFDQVLEGQLGGTGGDFAIAYVIAHEYGHHIQNLTGVLSRAQSRQTGPASPGVRVELQADCYAGVWAHHATTVTDDQGEVFISDLTDEDIAEAIDAAQTVGDDYIQQRTQGRIDPEQWTHGSSESRIRWFRTGFESGQLASCDTFAADSL